MRWLAAGEAGAPPGWGLSGVCQILLGAQTVEALQQVCWSTFLYVWIARCHADLGLQQALLRDAPAGVAQLVDGDFLPQVLGMRGPSGETWALDLNINLTAGAQPRATRAWADEISQPSKFAGPQEGHGSAGWCATLARQHHQKFAKP